MSININLDPSLSLENIAAAQQQGFSVMRSAHVGNARGYNLAVASMGIPMLLVDHNIVSQFPHEVGDRNYLPGSIVTREAIQPLKVSRVGGLALRTEVINPFSGDLEFVDQLHANRLKQAFPNTEVITNTNYLRDEETIAGEISGIALADMPELFTRAIESDGTVHKSKHGLADLAPNYGILQLNDGPRTERGLLMPNEVDIVINFAIEAIRSGKDTQIHLSGPDMQVYAVETKSRYTLNKIYQSVLEQASFSKQLPETLNVQLVPADQARFVTTRERLNVTRNIFDWLRYETTQIKEPKSNYFKQRPSTDTQDIADFLASFRIKEDQVSSGLAQAVSDASEIFVDSKDAPFVSQYDVLKLIDVPHDWIPIGPAGFAMPAENSSLNMSELRGLHTRLKKIRGRSP